jgi:hypothetical protein
VRRQTEQRPGDWDWERLSSNYRTGWTKQHGGAFTHGESANPPRALTGHGGAGGPLAAAGSVEGASQGLAMAAGIGSQVSRLSMARLAELLL